MVYLRNILVTTDLSEHSLAAMEYAASFGLLYASDIYLLYVAERHHRRGQAADGTNPAQAAEDLDKERASLEEFVARHMGKEIRVIPVVRSGQAAAEIARFAAEEGMDLVVMATHGWTGLKHILMGSVAERTVRLSRVPVLTVKPRMMRETIIDEQDIAQELHYR